MIIAIHIDQERDFDMTKWCKDKYFELKVVTSSITLS
jgi:hypothetical protein